MGFTDMANRLDSMLTEQQRLAMMADMPENYIQNSRTGAMTSLDQYAEPNALMRQMQPALDYKSGPVEMGGMKGYRLAGDPFTVMMPDGSRLSLGNDMAASRKRDMENIGIAEARQKLETSGIDAKIKKAQLDELMGIDPSAGVRSEVYSIETPPTFPVGQSPQLAVNQASIAHPERQKFLSRRFGQAPANYRWDEQGNAVPIPGVEPNLTDTQGNALTFAMKAQNALDQKAKAVDSEGRPYNLGFGEQVLSKAPFGVGQGFLEGPAQRFVNAEKNFIAAVLRKESGAAISQGEYDEYGPAFFDRPGDSPELLRDKAIARQTALESLKAQAGNQYDRLAKKAMGNVAAAVSPKAESSAPVKISSDADYAALPSGSMFIDPDGKTRRKP